MAEYEIQTLDNPIGKIWWEADNEVWQFSILDDDIRTTLRKIAHQGYVDDRESYQTSEIIAEMLVPVTVASEKFIGALTDHLMLSHGSVLGLSLDGRLVY